MERSYESASALVGRAAGPLSQHLTLYVDSLIRQQYVPDVVYVKAMHALSFDGWLARRGIGMGDLAEVTSRTSGGGVGVAEGAFVPRPGIGNDSMFSTSCATCLRSARVQTLRTSLRRRSILRPPTSAICGNGRAWPTRRSRGTVVSSSSSLQSASATQEVELRAVHAVDVIDVVRRQAQRLRPPTTKWVVNAMRSFLLYAQFRGDVTPELVAAVPAVATWTTTLDLLKAIAPKRAQRDIDSCDLGTAIGLRDRAVLLIPARLGLRAREIIAH